MPRALECHDRLRIGGDVDFGPEAGKGYAIVRTGRHEFRAKRAVSGWIDCGS